MARKHDAAKLLLEGNSLSEIAGLMGISVNSVGGYLFSLAGEGRIRRSDILFGIRADWRRTVEATIDRIKTSEAGNIQSALRKEGHTVDREELAIYLTLRDSRVSLGDMYEFIAEIEQILHEKIRAVLIDHYGEECWWREGVPDNIRKGLCRAAGRGFSARGRQLPLHDVHRPEGDHRQTMETVRTLASG